MRRWFNRSTDTATRSTELHTRATGQRVEAAAQRYLEAHGLVLVKRNHHCPAGEVDLIMRDGDYLVFVEVRHRRQGNFGSAAESVTLHKQRRIIKAANHFLLNHVQYHNCPARFDVWTSDGDGDNARITWIKDAFAGH